MLDFHFLEVHGSNSPCAVDVRYRQSVSSGFATVHPDSPLDTELDEEGASCQSAESVGQYPQRNERASEQAAEDDRESPAEDLADPAHQKSASDSTAVPNDGSDA